MELGRIDRSTDRLADLVYERLLEALATGNIAAGDRLVQDKLAEQLDVSRTPVREALLRLEKEGTIEPAGKRGFVVKVLERKELLDLYEAREAVEGYAARAAARRPDQAADHIERAISQALRMDLTSLNNLFTANQMIHRSVVEATDNDHLLDMFDSIWGRQMAIRAYAELFTTVPDHEDVTASHAKLLDSIRAGDPANAEAAMLSHIRDGLRLHGQEGAEATA